MKKQNIEEIFSSIEDFSSVPPPELWGQIEEKLNQPKKKKRAVLWWAAAACLLAGLMVPTVLHFSSDSEIPNINIDSNNTVVLEDKKPESNVNNAVSSDKNISTEQNTDNETIDKKAIDAEIIKTETATAETSSEKTAVSKTVSSQETGIAHSESKKTNSANDVLNLKSKEAYRSNDAVAIKTANTEKDNSLNAATKHQIANTAKRNVNKVAAVQNVTPKINNSFNVSSKNQISETENDRLDKAVAENGFKTNKQKAFNTASKQPFSNSVLDQNSTIKSNNNLTLNPSVSSLKDENKWNQDAVNSNFNNVVPEKNIADNSFKNDSKSTSKFGDALSKQDSVQLAELQNLEKGIIVADITKEEEKKKESKKVPNAEKWDLGVFAGVANSENYKNEKTLGNVNASKQSNAYGVKTRYKINKKWAVGSGLKFNELGQSIANVAYMSTQKEATFTQSDYLNQSVTVVKPHIANNSNYVFLSNNTRRSLKSSNIETGNINQSLKYIEMPLEVSYAVLTLNKASVSLNTGGFVGRLISNNVSLNGTSIGENIDANDFVYGSVLSSTVQYRIYKKTNLFVEPAMNYYVNPLDNQSFNQFQWGLNFGLNVSF